MTSRLARASVVSKSGIIARLLRLSKNELTEVTYFVKITFQVQKYFQMKTVFEPGSLTILVPMRTVGTMQELITRMLTETGLSASSLSRRSGVSLGALSLIMSGKRQPSFRTFQCLIQAAGLRWSWLDRNLSE